MRIQKDGTHAQKKYAPVITHIIDNMVQLRYDIAAMYKSFAWIGAGMVVIAIIILCGIMIGAAISFAQPQRAIELLEGTENALATTVLDRKGRVIAQFFAEEHREPIELNDMPTHLIHAILTREDQTFFKHRGFSFRGTSRALWNLVTNRYVSGGSTITQQLAGYFFADRNEFSISRKLKELWWAFQMERYWTKNQILEKYLNTMFFGHGNYGVEAASNFYFNRSAQDLTVAESTMLVIQLANPSLYSPINNPNEARTIQQTILAQMVAVGYITDEESRQSFEQFWQQYDYTRTSNSAAFFERNDEAPYFSEHVRYLLENEYLLGNADINRDGYTIHTTLDIDYQHHARRHMQEGINRANQIYLSNDNSSTQFGNEVIAMTELVSLAFNIPGFKDQGDSEKRRAFGTYLDSYDTLISMSALLFGSREEDLLRAISKETQYVRREREQRTIVEGALIAVENGSGHIIAMVGGSGFNANNQFNRAVNSRIEPGSSFKPLYYSAAIEKQVITPATLIYDSPVIFWNDDGTPYQPQNYRGVWQGPVLVRDALARSMNVPSLRVLELIGFRDALETARQLIGIEPSEMIERNLVRRYPVGLGVVVVSPLEMVRAYSVFANRGVAVEPLAIRYIEDRNGKVILELEKEHKRNILQNPARILSEETAYIMTNLLQSATSNGTLRYAISNAGGFNGVDIGGKTGTTQNWSDAWTVGFTPHITAAVWIGFDRGGLNSLGTNQTGAVTAGPVWAKFMRDVHQDFPPKRFSAPTSGITNRDITVRSGLLPPDGYTGEVFNEVFVSGTEPVEYDDFTSQEQKQRERFESRLTRTLLRSNAPSRSGIRFYAPTLDNATLNTLDTGEDRIERRSERNAPGIIEVREPEDANAGNDGSLLPNVLN